MSRPWSPIDPYLWRAVGEELSRLVRDFCRKRPLAAAATLVCVGFIVWKVMTASASLLPRNKPMQKTEVAGVLRIDGEPVSEGVIQFLPQRNRQATMTVIRSGTFKTLDVEPGQYRVLCFATREVEKKKKKQDAKTTEFPERVSIVPQKYREGVAVTIQSGVNDLSLDWKNE